MIQRQSLRILTVNVHKGFTLFNQKFILPELREAVRTVSADIVFLQEVIGKHHKFSLLHKNWPTIPQYEFLADTMWPEFAYGCNAVYPDGDHGNALLSKFPIVRYDNLDVSVEGPEKRGLLHCVIYAPPFEREINAICVHLGLREHHRRLQLDLLCDLVLSLPKDAIIIVAGDFNDWRLRASPILFQCAGLNEVCLDNTGLPPKTFPARWPFLRLDRIYVRNSRIYQPISLSNRPWSHLSDHAPLAEEFTL